MLFEITDDFEFVQPVPALTFQEMPFREAQLSKMVRTQLCLLMREPVLLIACEVTRKQATDTRIDIVALDTKARPIAIELKLQERGGTGDLQAIRGASVLADLTVEELCEMHDHFLSTEFDIHEPDAAYGIEKFLGVMPTALGEPRMLVISNGISPSMWRVLKLMQSKNFNIGLIDLAVRKVEGKLYLDATHLLCSADDTPRQTTALHLQEVFQDLTNQDIQQECPEEFLEIQKRDRAAATRLATVRRALPPGMMPPTPDHLWPTKPQNDFTMTPQPPPSLRIPGSATSSKEFTVTPPPPPVDAPRPTRRRNPVVMPKGYTPCEVINADLEGGPHRLRAWCPPEGDHYVHGAPNRPLDVPLNWVLGNVATAPQRNFERPRPLRAWCPPWVIKTGQAQPAQQARRGSVTTVASAT